MVIGYWTIRRTSDIKAEHDKRAKAKAVSARLVEMLMHTNRQYRATLHRWGLSEGLIDQEADNRQGAASTPPGGRPCV